MKGADLAMPMGNGTERSGKREQVQLMFNAIAVRYDRLNRLMSLNLDRRWRREAVEVLGLTEGDIALDLCCGTGDFLPLLRKKVGVSGRVLGVDFSENMLAIAAEKFPNESLSQADALALPIQSNSIDGVSVGWGIRNLADFDAAHREIWRVLKPGGRMASIDMAVPNNRAIAWLSRNLLGALLPFLGRLHGQKDAYTYLPQSALQFWNREKLAASMEQAGFINIGHKSFMAGNIGLIWGEKR